MANTILTSLDGLASAASNDSLYIVDASDVTESADGTSKKIAYSALITGLATSGANSDITSLSGLTTALSVAQGGTGRATLTSGSILVGAGTSQVSLYTTTGSGTVAVLATSPTLTSPSLTTPTLGVATATSINKVTITAPATSATLTLINGTTVTGPAATGTIATLAGTETLTNKTLTSPAFQGSVDGWIAATGSWTYASANTITVPSGAASLYQKGDRIKFTQTTAKYGVITAVADTLLTIAVNTDYVVANAAITLPYYSHQANPLGYPSFFNFTPGSVTWDGTPPSTPTTLAKYSVMGNICTVEIRITYTSAGTTNTQFTCAAPIAILNGVSSKYLTTYPCYMTDNAGTGAPVSYQTWGGTFATTTLYVNRSAAISANMVTLWAQYEI